MRLWAALSCLLAAFAGFAAYGVVAGGHTLSPGAAVAFLLVPSAALALALAGLAWDRHRAFARMRDAEQAFRDLYENISEGVFRSTLDGRMISANPSLVRLNGYSNEPEMLAAVNDIAAEWYVDPGRREELHRMLLETGQITNVVSEIRRHRTRERIWIEESVRLVRDKKTGEPLYYDGTLREVTETVRRLELQEHYNKIASIVSGCLFQFRISPEGARCVPYASVGLIHMYGILPEEVRTDSTPMVNRIHPEDRPKVAESLERSRASLTPWQCEFRICVPGQGEKWIFGHAVPEREADGSTLWHGYLADISERKRSEAQIHDLAYFDPLTRLPNRTMLHDALRQLAEAGTPQEGWNALLFIDLDRFKVLNDSKGHHIGDLLLCEVAGRLRAQMGEGDLVARLGGDEFVVLLRNLPGGRGDAGSIVDSRGREILASIDAPFDLDGNVFRTTASIGATLFRAGDCDMDEVLKCADLAMYEAKASGRDTLRHFAPTMRLQIEDRMALTADLREAISGGLLMLCYQPQVDRRGQCVGAEALLRWEHPTRGPIAPTEIIAVAEQQGLINLLEEWVLNAACITLAAWQRDPLTRGLHLAVNVTAHQLNRRGFIGTVKEALAASGADPKGLSLELTEHVMLDNIDEVSAVMLELKALGIGFALDDFGTGYSSLSYLKRLPISALKIDRSFVSDIEADPSDREIVQTIVNIAASLHVAVIAEGVEAELQALLLRQMGVDYYQGYLFGRPMPAAALIEHLGDRATATVAMAAQG